jgi:hypothetical protein
MEYLYDLNDYCFYSFKNGKVKLKEAHCFARFFEKADFTKKIGVINKNTFLKEHPNNDELSFRYYFDELEIKFNFKDKSNDLCFLKKGKSCKILKKHENYYLISIKTSDVKGYDVLNVFFDHLKTKNKYYIGWVKVSDLTIF